VGRKFLEEKSREPGVLKRDSGVLYKILKHGNGTHHPAVTTNCVIHFEGRLATGELIESTFSRKRPAKFPATRALMGPSEMMQLMVEGDEWELYLPAELAYGDRGRGTRVPAHSAVVFRMVMVKVDGPGPERGYANPDYTRGSYRWWVFPVVSFGLVGLLWEGRKMSTKAQTKSA